MQKGSVIRRRAVVPQAIYAKAGHDHTRRHESSRVRPDHVSCCIVLPTPGNWRLAPKAGVSSAFERSGRETDEGIPGRGSCVRLTSSVVNRSWLSEYVRIHFLHTYTLGARQGCPEVAHVRCISTRRQRSIRGRAAPPKRATTSSNVVRTGPLEGLGNRADQGARMIREMGRSRSYVSLVRRSVVSKDTAGHRRI
jgi:hypothetical protein